MDLHPDQERELLKAEIHAYACRVDELEAEVKRLGEMVDESQLRSIEARNPGIDMDDVRRIRQLHRVDL